MTSKETCGRVKLVWINSDNDIWDLESWPLCVCVCVCVYPVSHNSSDFSVTELFQICMLMS
jgi:hypothetical protein